ncbi:unnamed protein product [Protopolystoma xenopodis]|uniref:Uncharacterized protein n=1 Tax=Protopolystoma xenopodis TaxID=117903 RepID=A0A448X8U3_9PLAT|nr:unnamed protein product [Protopolystoma xenopodis]
MSGLGLTAGEHQSAAKWFCQSRGWLAGTCSSCLFLPASWYLKTASHHQARLSCNAMFLCRFISYSWLFSLTDEF